MRGPGATVFALFLLGALAGCLGDIRSTTTPRTATEMLLVSTAAERAVAKVDSSKFVGKRVFLDVSLLKLYDQGYVESAFRNFLEQGKGTLVPGKDKADVVVEVRSGALGMYDLSYAIGIPLPVGGAFLPPPGSTIDHWPQLISIGYDLHEGWCRLQVWAYDAKTDEFVGSWHDCWGMAYMGFFDDIYPSSTVAETAKGYAR